MRFRFVFLSLVVSALLASAAPALGQAPVTDSTLAADGGRTGAFTAAGLPVSAAYPLTAGNEVVLRPGDMLQVRVWPDASMGGDFVVEETGQVYLPFLGSVQATGRSLSDLRERIRSGYGVAMKNPVITVTPMYRIGILGSVNRPGVYLATPTTGLFDIVAQAGGFSADARQDKVRIVRDGSVVEVDALRALEEGAGLSDVMLRSGDQIIVPGDSGGFGWGTAMELFRTAITVGLLVERVSR